MNVLDKGEVTLLAHLASDIDVVAAARVSNDVEYATASQGIEKDAKLIRYLVKHRHGSPFEHTYFRWFVKCPLFVAREWHRHRMASYNEVSGRYTVFGPEFYVPDVARGPAATNKQGSVPFSEDDAMHGWLSEQILQSANASFEQYEKLLNAGIAKEMARMVLPLNTYTKFYASSNARSLMNFLSLRNAPDAQWEIQQYAKSMEVEFARVMPLTHAAWVDNDRITP